LEDSEAGSSSNGESEEVDLASLDYVFNEFGARR